MLNKLCKKCNTSKQIEEFSKNKRKKDGLDLYCKECNNLRMLKGRPDEHLRLYEKINNVRYCSNCSSYIRSNLFIPKRGCCKACMKIKDKIYAEENKDAINLRHKKWLEKNSGSVKAWKSAYYKEKTKNDYNYRLTKNMSSGIRQSLLEGKKNLSWTRMVDYTVSELREHLLIGISPDNYDKVLNQENHIDHIVPISYFDYTSHHSLEFILCWRLENLRLLDGVANMEKSDRIGLDCQRQLLEEITFYRRYPDMYRICRG